MDAQTQKALIALYKEAYEGAQEKWTWFVDNEPDCGILGTLAKASAADASAPAPDGNSTLGAHASHLLFSLEVSLAYMNGEHPQADWESSWNKQQFTDEEWTKLRADIQDKYNKIQSWLASNTNWDDMSTHGSLGLLAHGAYHLGVMRQLLPAAAKPASVPAAPASPAPK